MSPGSMGMRRRHVTKGPQTPGGPHIWGPLTAASRRQRVIHVHSKPPPPRATTGDVLRLISGTLADPMGIVTWLHVTWLHVTWLHVTRLYVTWLQSRGSMSRDYMSRGSMSRGSMGTRRHHVTRWQPVVRNVAYRASLQTQDSRLLLIFDIIFCKSLQESPPARLYIAGYSNEAM
jgi:hypothetical protein